ncbi:class III lanthionine synthetase LanKC [Streptomyces sp. B6B3]|uniref:class III lanthionine synthetase LanKC n=1 Tax=Streptomyces sp. B6B3 TaxID=3153570 RepID=UPI00325E503A
MDKRYEVFCLADRYFYETPDRIATRSNGGEAAQELYETARRPVPDGWLTQRSGDWLHVQPTGGEMLLQGWKIHVSACLDNADAIAAKLWDYCVPRRIPFKFVPSKHLLYLRNSKYAKRDNSGKFATLYPNGEKQLRDILEELHPLVAGEPGPYILTDLRWHEGPLFVRYGAFAVRHCDDGKGALVGAIEDPEGRLVPDRRDPSFSLPDWVTLPEFLAPHLAARNTTTVADLPYRITGAMHFSNGGGVYDATDTRTGERVVLKEGRPHAGLAADGADAVARLERERAALERLSGLGVAPEVRDWFTLGDHRFLVMERLPGRPLNSFFAERHPLLAVDPDPDAVSAFTRWALTVYGAVERAVDALHGRGLVFNDLHMFNIMVDPDEESVRLLDFEAAAYLGDDPDAGADVRQIVAHPGFVAPPDRTGFGIDRYALACLRLALFLPMTTLLAVDRGKAAHLAEVAAEQFPEIPADFLAEAVAEIERGGPTDGGDAVTPVPPAPDAAEAGAGTAAPDAGRDDRVRADDWPRSRDAMVRAILASATPERDDRLFPGDVSQFAPAGGLCLAYGAAGVLYALAETGAARYPEGEEWLLRGAGAPPTASPLGLYDGLLGVAFVLHRLGHHQIALDLVDRSLGERWERLPAHLFGGLAGVGLVYDELAAADGDGSLDKKAARATELAAQRLDEPPPAPGRKCAGLLYGASGSALLFLRRYERTGDRDLLDLAARALRRDLDLCVTGRDGSLMVDEKVRAMPYLGEGSVGIAAVLDDYLAHRPDEDFARAREQILIAARLRYYAQPGLFHGRAGMVWNLARTAPPGATDPGLAAQVRHMDWYAMPYRDGLAFPGNQMMRLSMDLVTGTAGCLLALGSATRHRVGAADGTTHEEGPPPGAGGPEGAPTARLPFLPPPPVRP